MKSLYLSLLIVWCFQLNAQNKEITISGRVIGSKYKKAIPKALVRLYWNDKSVLEVHADSIGNYSLKKIIQTNTVAVLEADAPEKKLVGSCPYSFKNTVFYFPTKLKLIFSIDSIPDHMVQDIELTEGDIDYELPSTVYFNMNSLDLSLKQENYYTTDTAMDCVVDYALAYPKTFLTVVGYADKAETNKQGLSLQRAKLIYDLLLKKGVDKKRICYAGESDRVSIKKQEFESENEEIRTNSKVELKFTKTACVTKTN